MSDPWSGLSQRVVMVSSFAERDGIAKYAEQLIAARLGDREVLRVGIPEGPGDYHRDFHRRIFQDAGLPAMGRQPSRMRRICKV